MAEHRVPVLGGALHRYVDPSLSSDPRVRELVAALSTLEIAPPPRAHFRAELRSQLVAVTPRLVAEGPAELVRHTPQTVAAAEAHPSRARTLASRIPHLRLGRPVRIVAVALTVIAMAMSGAVWLSRSALPGDALYGLKRASENAKFSLTSGNVARGKELLSFAKTRVDEVTDLLSTTSASAAGIQASGGDNHTASLVRSTLGSADDDVRQASQLLGSQAVHDKSSSPLAVMINWAPEQMTRLGQVVARTPSGSLRDRVMSSAKLLSDAYTRAQELKALQGCSCLNSTSSDSLGPIPCTACTASTPNNPNQQHSNQPGSSANTKNRTATSNPGSSTNPNSTANPNNPTPTPNPAQPGGPNSSGSTAPNNPLPTSVLPTLPTLPLPSLTLPTTAPVTVDSCGAGVTLGPIGIGVGTCGIHVHI